jgi:hypothetical protein
MQARVTLNRDWTVSGTWLLETPSYGQVVNELTAVVCGGDGGGTICGGAGAFVSWLTIATAYRTLLCPRCAENNARIYLRPAIPL